MRNSHVLRVIGPEKTQHRPTVGFFWADQPQNLGASSGLPFLAKRSFKASASKF